MNLIEIKEHGNGIYIIKLIASEVSNLDIPNLYDKLSEAVVNKSIKKLVLDLSGVHLITSSGIGIFLDINQKLNSGLKIASAKPEVLQVLNLTKITSMIHYYETVEAAIKSFKS